MRQLKICFEYIPCFFWDSHCNDISFFCRQKYICIIHWENSRSLQLSMGIVIRVDYNFQVFTHRWNLWINCSQHLCSNQLLKWVNTTSQIVTYLTIKNLLRAYCIFHYYSGINTAITSFFVCEQIFICIARVIIGWEKLVTNSRCKLLYDYLTIISSFDSQAGKLVLTSFQTP